MAGDRNVAENLPRMTDYDTLLVDQTRPYRKNDLIYFFALLNKHFPLSHFSKAQSLDNFVLFIKCNRSQFARLLEGPKTAVVMEELVSLIIEQFSHFLPSRQE
jgi:hypothetical protein